MGKQSILAIHAHPDDTEILCAGTLAFLASQGWTVTIATMTEGSLGGVGMTVEETIKTRFKEATEAAAKLGAEYACLGGQDGFLYDTADLRKKTAALIRRIKADIVITHLPQDYHPDHRATYAIAESAALFATLPSLDCGEPPLAATPHLYHTSPFGFRDILGAPPPPPHFFIDVTEVMETKMEMLGCHRSQRLVMQAMHGMDAFFEEMKNEAQALGRRCGAAFAEVFWHHLGGGFPREPRLQEELSRHLRHETGGHS